MSPRLRDFLLLLVALLLLAVVVGAALLLSRTRSLLPGPTPTPAPEQTAATDPATRAMSSPTAAPAGTRTAGADPAVVATAPGGPHSPAVAPTASATPTLTPSPTPGPSARLANADRARRNGDYARARDELARVIAASEDADEVTAARYQAAVLAYQDGDLQAAKEALLQFIDEHPGDHRVPAAHFYRAETLSALGEHAAALEHYAAYLGYQDVLADLVYARVGRIHRFIGQPLAAAEAYEQAAQHAPDLATELDDREQVALAYQAAGAYAQAQAELEGIAARTENPYRLAQIGYRIGANQRLLGDEQAALDAFVAVVNGDPRPGYAHMALVELVHAGVEVDEYQRGLIDYYAQSYQAAVEAFARYVDATPGYDGDAHYYAARSWLALGQPARAIRECDDGLARPDAKEYTSRWGDLWLLQAEAEAEEGDVDRAVATYRRFAEAHPDDPLAPEALWQAALLLQQDHRYAEAADGYATLANRYPGDGQAPQARFRAGLWRYRLDDVDAALGAWQALARTAPDTQAGRQGRYWLGKTLWQQGREGEARQVLEALAQQHPQTYEGLRAAHLLAQQGRALPWSQRAAPVHLTYAEGEARQEVLAWLRTWADLPDPLPAGQVSPELAGELRFRRALEMHTLGLHQEALAELDALRKDLAGRADPLGLYQFSLVTRDLELYAPSLRAAIDLLQMAPEGSVLDVPPLVQRLAYPAYYADLILAESATYDLDPLLLFALIRQESVYDAQVTSWAGAVGLAQVMPATGEWIAEMTGWPEYDPSQLERAYVNVKFGAWFLDRILERAEGDVMTALAGYNGGPSLALQWRESALRDPDLFVELIPKEETQRYVRAIYRQYDVYQRLYGEGEWELGG